MPILVCFIPLWGIYGIIKVIFGILGFILVPIAVFFKAYEERENFFDKNRTTKHFTWWFMYPWDNLEDGIEDGYWIKDYKNETKQILYWSCIRNPANNLRFMPITSIKIDQSKIRYIAKKGFDVVNHSNNDDIETWYICWQGLFGCLRLQFRTKKAMYRLWFGFKIRPNDIIKVEPEWRRHGIAFTMQFRRSRKY